MKEATPECHAEDKRLNAEHQRLLTHKYRQRPNGYIIGRNSVEDEKYDQFEELWKNNEEALKAHHNTLIS